MIRLNFPNLLSSYEWRFLNLTNCFDFVSNLLVWDYQNFLLCNSWIFPKFTDYFEMFSNLLVWIIKIFFSGISWIHRLILKCFGMCGTHVCRLGQKWSLSEYEMSFLLGIERRYQLNIYSFKLLDNSFIEWFNWLNYRGFQSWCRSSSFPGWGNLSHKSTNAWLRYTKFECWQKANQPSVTEFIKAKADATQGATVVYLM